MNPRLALLLAWRRLGQHRLQSAVTLLGVALGLTVAAAILIVDHNSNERRIASLSLADLSNVAPSRPGQAKPTAPRRILRVSFERGVREREAAVARTGSGAPAPQSRPIAPPAIPVRIPKVPLPSPLPSQEGLGAGGVSADRPLPRRGEEDYQAMRLAVRLASLMAFAVGAVIVFYSMRFAVASRGRELMLLLCLGQERRGLGLSLTLEATMLGIAGTLFGLLAGWWAGMWLLDAGVSTTGRSPDPNPDLPIGELALLAALSLSIALLGVVAPLRSLLRMQPVAVLQPRFLAEQDAAPGPKAAGLRGFGWLVPILLLASWLAIRPILRDWLSVLQFFLVEAAAAAILGLAVLWWMAPVLRGAVRLMEWVLRPLLPLEALLAGRRLRVSARELVFTVAAVTLVFSLVIALDGLTRALKAEIDGWGAEALDPYVFLDHRPGARLLDDAVFDAARAAGLLPMRLSHKVEGEIPMRLIHADDANAFLNALGWGPLTPQTLLVSRTLAARFALAAGDRVIIDTDAERYAFRILAVTDGLGYYAEDGQYVDLRSWFLFHHRSPLFAGNLSLTLGDRLAVRRAPGSASDPAAERAPNAAELARFSDGYRIRNWGRERRRWQTGEIDRDFSIFDFILGLTLVLAAVGVANSLLIQVLTRRRELSLLRTLGVSRTQTLRLLLVEGAVIGGVGGLFSLLLGQVFAAIGIGFLDRFTLFDYALSPSPGSALGVFALAVVTCSLAALYPALVAERLASAESLHYE